MVLSSTAVQPHSSSRNSLEVQHLVDHPLTVDKAEASEVEPAVSNTDDAHLEFMISKILRQACQYLS